MIQAVETSRPVQFCNNGLQLILLMKCSGPKAVFVLAFFLLLMSQPLLAQRLNLGDGVRLTFYNIEDEVSGDYFVMNDWTIQLPYVGQVMVRDRIFDSIHQEILTGYEKIYRDPELTIQPLFKINILGEVRSPGVFFVTGVERLSDLMALAGGETLDADLDEVFLVRENERININARQMLKNGDVMSDLGLRSGDQVYVSRAGLVSYRNASLLISGIGVAATIAAIFIVRR